MFEPFQRLKSGTVVLRQANIDTDQIIPARFLTTTSREGLGENAFYDWRYDDAGAPREDSPLDGPEHEGHAILVAGPNFGCGSSREHAPWALSDFGFRAVVSSDIADIFKSNALKNGLLPVEIDAETHAKLLDRPGREVTIDLEQGLLTSGNDIEARFTVEPFARQCLLEGNDPLGYLTDRMDAITAYEDARA
ncbi:3-isopropylmalate dehydratase small subunit [Novosphingopyxis sp. YJ-S2-01]|uniref:3-isopropylmalate dehydratase small subunit n=1 Tax=Novosphingopyxis sp. YJ-S2-01 TaxID=2794021 RepID=UPI001E455423|nr:3-isopropylmalate dehydratase small subunit [Novosphingopyxis sp. YJ-S2-01]